MTSYKSWSRCRGTEAKYVARVTCPLHPRGTRTQKWKSVISYCNSANVANIIRYAGGCSELPHGHQIAGWLKTQCRGQPHPLSDRLPHVILRFERKRPYVLPFRKNYSDHFWIFFHYIVSYFMCNVSIDYYDVIIIVSR